MFSGCVKNKNKNKNSMKTPCSSDGGMDFNEFPPMSPISTLPRMNPPFNSDTPTTSFGYDCSLPPHLPPKQHGSTTGFPPHLPPKQHGSTTGHPPHLPPKQRSLTMNLSTIPPFVKGPINVDSNKTTPPIDETDTLLVVRPKETIRNDSSRDSYYDNDDSSRDSYYDNTVYHLMPCSNQNCIQDIFPSPITNNDADYVEMDGRKQRSLSNAGDNSSIIKHNPIPLSKSELSTKTHLTKPFPKITTKNSDEEDNFKILLYYFNLLKEENILLKSGKIHTVRLDKYRVDKTKGKYKTALKNHSEKYGVPIWSLTDMVENRI
ncbi:MAG: hypothetical protein KFW09_03615 [Oscillospiraceae bacterium]|nr:hypothetical protein [Oscillospiraceae bacterium]